MKGGKMKIETNTQQKMKKNNSPVSLFTGIKWHRLEVVFLCKKASVLMKNHPISVIQAIVKTVSGKTPPFSSLQPSSMPIFHIKDKKHSYKMKPMDQIPIEFLFFNHQPEAISVWKKNLEEYLEEPVYRKTFEILSLEEPEERTYSRLTCQLATLPDQGELCLEFLMPLPVKREPGRSRVYISKEKLIRLYEKRFFTLFGKNFTYQPGEDDFSLLPYYWNYTEIKHPSKSQPGHIQFINGMAGKLYIKGKWKNFLPFLILGSEVHIGTRLANSQGYYKILADSPPHFERTFPQPKTLVPVIRDVIDRYDQALETLSKAEMYPFDEQAFARELCREIEDNSYLPSPNKAFVIRQKNKKDRLVEQLSFRDLIVARYLLKTIYKNFDNIFEEESIGYRKGISRDKALRLVETALQEGYGYVVESDIEDFFPSIDPDHLKKLLEFYLPCRDTRLKELLVKLIDNGYILDGRHYERLKGLPLGNPLSPLLANLYLDAFDEHVKSLDVRLVRYADDFIVLCKDKNQAATLLEEAQDFLGEIGLKIKTEKTALHPVADGFRFLGITFNGRQVSYAGKEKAKLFKKPLYITTPYVFLSLNGDAAVIKKDQRIIESIPLRRINEVMVMEKTVFSTAFIRYCVENGIPFTITLNSGYYITTIKPDNKKYFQISYSHGSKFYSLGETELLCIAKEFAAGKLSNYIAMFKQKYRDVGNEFLDEMYEVIARIHQSGDIFQVRGLEGIAARKTFDRFNHHIKNPAFHLEKRLRKNPDRINSLLNFGYYLLFSRINATVRAAGLNPYLGFLHSAANNYESLVCDIQELFRANIDHIIIRIVNLGIIREDDFSKSRGGFYLDKQGVSKYLNYFEKEINQKKQKAVLSLKDHIYLQVMTIKNWLLENKSLTFYKWDVK